MMVGPGAPAGSHVGFEAKGPMMNARHFVWYSVADDRLFLWQSSIDLCNRQLWAWENEDGIFEIESWGPACWGHILVGAWD